MTPIAGLAVTAAEEFRTLHSYVGRAVAAGRVTRQAAEQRLKAWLAIACRLGSELPQLDAGMAYQREAFPRDRESFLRADYADQICPRSIWIVELARTRDKAFDAAEAAADTPEAPALIARAIALRQLADHFAFDINGTHPLPHYVPPEAREAASRQAAA